jgi:CHAT domain-containing protein
MRVREPQCHTTVGDEESPDEAIHLVSAIQFAGLRSVIGTMWAVPVDDEETNKITFKLYENMSDGCDRLITLEWRWRSGYRGR